MLNLLENKNKLKAGVQSVVEKCPDAFCYSSSKDTKAAKTVTEEDLKGKSIELADCLKKINSEQPREVVAAVTTV